MSTGFSKKIEKIKAGKVSDVKFFGILLKNLQNRLTNGQMKSILNS